MADLSWHWPLCYCFLCVLFCFCFLFVSLAAGGVVQALEHPPGEVFTLEEVKQVQRMQFVRVLLWELLLYSQLVEECKLIDSPSPSMSTDK